MAKKGQKRVIVISGASSGLGAGLKRLYEQQGDVVVGLSRTDCGGNWIACDVTDRERVRAAVEEIGAKYGRIDVLVNNAGVGVSGAVELTTDEEYESVMKTNVDGVFFLSRAALRFMERGGKIVNISSTCALFALPFRALYCAAKAAVSMLSYGMRMELKDSGIDVVTVCPGEIKTSFTQNRRKNFQTNARYGNRVERAAAYIDGKEDKRMDCEKACCKIKKIIDGKRGATYIVGGKYKALRFISRFVSQNALLRATDSLMGGR